MSERYEVILGFAARQVLYGLPSQADREGLADALEEELDDGPNRDAELTIDRYNGYVATPLSFEGYTAVHRPLTQAECKRYADQAEREIAEKVFLVVDILKADSGFRNRSI
ncbi:hypothetical protein [Streptomyces sp. NPDC003077]|uniref:hypothetical protein n=1 Tax=Streptomyces sp. NPDC003077 TaxID=3154443 RepID=UPI0033A9DFCA